MDPSIFHKNAYLDSIKPDVGKLYLDKIKTTPVN